MFDTSVVIELLNLEANVRERELVARLQVPGQKLTFNSRPIARVILAAIATARREIADRSNLPRAKVTMAFLSLAVYHMEESMIYLAVDLALPLSATGPASGPTRVGIKVWAGGLPGRIETVATSAKDCDMILEWMDCIDLAKVVLLACGKGQTGWTKRLSNFSAIDADPTGMPLASKGI